ncbi:MAG: DUF4330 domain-containing protein [Clostridiales bacterium]|nr:DUF4330 domain-containing protein [Clostridiales bacterium]
MSNRTERRGKLFGLFNILDLTVVIFIAALAVVLVMRGSLRDRLGGASPDVEIHFSVRLEPVRIMTYMALEKDQPLFDEETGMQIGVITKFTATPYMREVTLSNGSILLSPDPEYYTVIVHGVGSGRNSEYGPMLGGSRLCSPGGLIKLGSTRLSSNGSFDTVEVRTLK